MQRTSPQPSPLWSYCLPIVPVFRGQIHGHLLIFLAVLVKLPDSFFACLLVLKVGHLEEEGTYILLTDLNFFFKYDFKRFIAKSFLWFFRSNIPSNSTRKHYFIPDLSMKKLRYQKIKWLAWYDTARKKSRFYRLYCYHEGNSVNEWSKQQTLGLTKATEFLKDSRWTFFFFLSFDLSFWYEALPFFSSSLSLRPHPLLKEGQMMSSFGKSYAAIIV